MRLVMVAMLRDNLCFVPRPRGASERSGEAGGREPDAEEVEKLAVEEEEKVAAGRRCA